MTSMVRAALAIWSVCLVGGCALGPVGARQKAEAASDVPRDHPHPPARMAVAPLDGSMDKLYCYTDGPDTICHRQAGP